MRSELADTPINFLGQKQPRTVDQCRQALDMDANKRGNWRILTREMFNSRAFAALNKSGMVVVLAMLDKLDYHSKKKPIKDRKNVSTGSLLKNGGTFCLIGNELKARGLKSEKAIADGRRQAWQLGFCDTLVTGTVLRAGEFRYSERWKQYPDGDYLPHDQQPPGANMYHRFSKSDTAILPAKNAGRSCLQKVQVEGTRALPVISAGNVGQISPNLPA